MEKGSAMDLAADMDQICLLLLPTSLLQHAELRNLVEEQSELAKVELRQPRYAERAISLYQSTNGCLNIPEAQLKSKTIAAFSLMFRELVVEGVEKVVQARAIHASLHLPRANPADGKYKDLRLDVLHRDTISELSTRHFAVQDGLLTPAVLLGIHAEVLKMEAAGGLHVPYQQRTKGVRFDKFAWLQASDPAASTQWPLLAEQMRRLETLPYELNGKLGKDTADSQLRTSPLFMLSCYAGDGATYQKHFDSGKHMPV
jgi:hypothetical protein